MVRLGLRVMPKSWRKHNICERLGLWANAKALRQHFADTEAERDNHTHWVAIEGGSSVLKDLDIPHPEKNAGPGVWRAFLAQIVVAADEGNIKKAREIMSNEDFMREAEREEVRRNPGKGDLVVRVIMNSSTTDEVQYLYDLFKREPNGTSEIDVFAAYSLKMHRFLTEIGADEELEQEWWRSQFDVEAKRLDDPDGITWTLDKFKKDYPDDAD